MTIKGKSQTVRIPLFAGPTVNGQIFDGSFDISRSAFGIGDAQWNGIIDDKVHITFHLVQPTPV
jgi:hypothetical protein